MTTPGSFGILSTYPPTACGLATFSAALVGALVAQGHRVGVVRVLDGDDVASASPVVGSLVNGSASSVAGAAALLDGFDVAVVQHEYGVYGGSDGDEVVAVLAALHVPSIVVAHTVLTHPTPHQRSVLEAVGLLAERVVVMSHAARVRLCSHFDVDPAKVVTIPHGAALVDLTAPTVTSERPTLLTWGLIGPGKGLDRVVDAMRTLRTLPGRPRYLIAGRTHPKVLAAEGEAYRNARMAQAWRVGVSTAVEFDPSYRDVASLGGLIRSAAVVVLPYDTDDQVTSGVLADAIVAGRPVVATAFPHAVELLGSGAGLVVDHSDPQAMVDALRRVLTEPDLAGAMAAEAARLAPAMSWPVVAKAYAELGRVVGIERVALV